MEICWILMGLVLAPFRQILCVDSYTSIGISSNVKMQMLFHFKCIYFFMSFMVGGCWFCLFVRVRYMTASLMCFVWISGRAVIIKVFCVCAVNNRYRFRCYLALIQIKSQIVLNELGLLNHKRQFWLCMHTAFLQLKNHGSFQRKLLLLSG